MSLLPFSCADSDTTNALKRHLIRLLVWIVQYLDIGKMSKQHVDTENMVSLRMKGATEPRASNKD